MSGIPPSNLSYPVLLECDDGSTATGFYFRTDRSIFLVTARHVLFKKRPDQKEQKDSEPTHDLREKVKATSYPANLDWSSPTCITLKTKPLFESQLLRYHATQDAAVCKIADSSPTNPQDGSEWITHMAGVNVVTEEAKLTTVAPDAIRKYADVREGDDAYIYGYPVSLGMKRMPQIDYRRPLLRKGVIAGKNEQRSTIILDCPSYYGNSGGPVTAVETVSVGKSFYPVIGLVADFVPFVDEWRNVKHQYSNIQIENSGYSVVVPMDTVLELVRAIETSDQ